MQVAQLLLRMSRSYGIVWNSRAACWRWLFQVRKFWRFTCSQYSFNLFARWHQHLGSRGGSLGHRIGVGRWKL